MESASVLSPVSSYADDKKREDKYDGACSHTLCGCYPVDPVQYVDEDGEEYTVADNGINPGIVQKKKHKGEDFLARFFAWFSWCCCGCLCKCWVQGCSICALAQEARETRLLIPPKLQRIDYITHQPFYEYQPAINDIRREWKGKGRDTLGIMAHFKALSQLSRHIISTFFAVAVVVTLTLIFNPRSNFSWYDAIVVIATFLQSFIVLVVVFGIFHKSDLSLDAVVKFFASGFAIAVPIAFVTQFIMLNGFVSSSYCLYFLINVFSDEAFASYYDDNYEMFWIAGELLHAFLVASITEELCKYYAFRNVEHPDLIFLTGLDRATNEVVASLGGGYAYDSHQISASASRGDDDMSYSSRSSRRSRSSRSSRRKKSAFSILDDSSQASTSLRSVDTDEEYYEDENDVRSHRQRAMAVTTGMISVAVGLACAENLLYVFFLNGFGEDGIQRRTQDEWLVLLFRSIFPVHALAAAMQSIGVIKKFLEPRGDEKRGIGVGKIIFPAVLLHGFFDAVLMSINVYIETSYDNFYDGGGNGKKEPYNVVILNLTVAVSLILIMAVSGTWYYIQNRKQSRRLKRMEKADGTYEDASHYSHPTYTTQSHSQESSVV
uniref:PrsW family intramembrane metalloprotease n=1 Tax=Ditylum brightwellii TaxID=49249 RepID=A0A7S1YZ27_9STRA